ncbi:hypothetical protein [Actinoplanes sichuanensis]|uniref:Uncharacterized protein n=1 Tax=Actinoplanes sichuanensis TaxID=512349 RepID=A0ABW4A516_9ACTN|nr:hypothetical protein [Actinoplanes sichuanensis]
MDLAEVEKLVSVIDLAIEPIATRPVGPDESGFGDPLVEAGVVDEASVSLGFLLDAYESGPEAVRGQVRAIFRKYPYFAWAAAEKSPVGDAVRRQIVHLSALDQGNDARDLIVALDDLVRRARGDGIDVESILLEVAGMSAAEDRMGMGSTREILLRAAGVPLE